MRLAVWLGLAGVAPALVGLSQSVPLTALAWTALGVAWLVVVLRARDARPFRTLLLAGILAGVVAALVQAPFAPAAQRVAVASFGLLAGVVWGALFGALALAARRFSPGSS